MTPRPLHVLWFTNIPMPAVARRSGREVLGSGHWMTMLLDALRARDDLRLGVATAYPGTPAMSFVDAGVSYYTISQPRFTSQLGAARARDLDACAEVVRAFRPDVIHVHGSERFYGLLAVRRLVDVPVVVSLQGLVSEYAKSPFGALSCREVLRAERIVEVLTRRGLLWSYLDTLRSARREERILRSPAAFLGRTGWDHDKVLSVNPSGRYFHVGELLRPQFGEPPWNLGTCRRERLFLTNVGSPRRGLETVLAALALLRARRPALELSLAGAVREGSGYGRFVHQRVRELGLTDRVHFLGYLDAPTLARELRASHAYVIASLAENSPNSLCEAMRLGMPCVASAAGGIPSLVEDGRTGLLFPPGDAPALARRIEELLSSDALAVGLGAAARDEAARRHDPGVVIEELLTAYRAVARTAARARSESLA